MDHPSRAELATLCGEGLSQKRTTEVVCHLLFGRCPECLAAVEPQLSILLGLATPEDAAYDAAIERAVATALKMERHLRQQRTQAARGVKALAAGRKLPRDLECLAKMMALLEWSWQLRHDDPREMVQHAWCAANTSLQLNPLFYGPQRVCDHQARAQAELGNAYRAANRPQDAEQALDQARRLFERGTGDELLETRLLELEASLYADLREFSRAAQKLLKVFKFYNRQGDLHSTGRTLVKMGLYAGYAGNGELAIKRLQQSLDMIDAKHDPGLARAAVHNLILFLVESDRIPEAKRLRLVHSRHLLHSGGRVNQVKFRALEGCIETGLGNYQRAETIFREVREGFEAAGLPILAGIAALDLAAVLLRQSKAATRTIFEAAEIFYRLGIRREALQAISMLRDSFEMGVGNLEMVLEVAAFLRRLEIDPVLRFEARSWNRRPE